MTMEGQAAGTPAYMAPEASLGEQRIDGRSDLYSVGCVAYYLLTGRLLFEEATATATALAHVQKVVVPPSERTEMPVPPDLETLILACLAKKPEDRPHSAQELSRRLAALQCAGEWGRDEAAGVVAAEFAGDFGGAGGDTARIGRRNRHVRQWNVTAWTRGIVTI